MATYLISSLSLLSGGLIYICYRPLSLAIFSTMRLSDSSVLLQFIRDNAPKGLPEWIVYNLPDGLWAFSYSIFIGAIWNFECPKCIPIAMIIPCVGIVSEIMQFFNILPGVFDLRDFIMYLIGGFAGVLYISIFHSIILNKNFYEKK